MEPYKRRTKYAIFYTILTKIKINPSVSSSRLSVRANLSGYTLRKYINNLISYNLLEHDKDAKRYFITEKGETYITLFDEINELLEIDNVR